MTKNHTIVFDDKELLECRQKNLFALIAAIG